MTDKLTVHASMTTYQGVSHKIPDCFYYGKIIGTYLDHPIYGELTDNHGVVRAFGGIAMNGQEVLPGSLVIRPGLLYEIQ